MKPRTEKEVRQAFVSAIAEHYPRITLFSNPSGRATYNGRHVSYGLTKGAADLIGWVRQGRGGDALFLAVELKANPKSRYREGQREFLDRVNAGGGIGLTVHSENWQDTLRDLARIAGHRYRRPAG